MSSKDTKDAIARITKMEAILDRSQELLDTLEKDLENLRNLQTDLKILEDYYASKEWKEDLAMDEKGKLPDDLKRGVLSEDGIYNLLERNKEIFDALSDKP